MKKVIALVLCVMLAVALVGCSGGGGDGVVGTWKEIVPEEQKQELIDTVGEDMAQIALDRVANSSHEFKEDGTYIFHSYDQQDYSGTYTLEGNKVIITTDNDNLELELDGNTMKLNGIVVTEKQ